MTPTQDLAIVLRSTPYQDRHRIVTALTAQHGQISALAKNSIQSRRFGGTLEPFAASEWTFSSRPNSSLHILTEAVIREPFENLRTDLNRIALAGALTEIMLRIAPHTESCLDLFKLHSNALAHLNENKTVHEFAFLNAYLAKLLHWSGSQPHLSSCLQCQMALQEVPPDVDLKGVISNAGWLCPVCSRSPQDVFPPPYFKVKSPVLEDFELSLQLPIRQLEGKFRGTPPMHRDLYRFIEALYIFHIPGFDQRPIKSLRLLGLESILQHPPENPQSMKLPQV